MIDNVIGAAVGLTFGLSVGILLTVSRSQASIRRMEGRINALLKHAGIDPEVVAMEEVTRLAQAGRKIEAIKALRELTGCGLAEAKIRVESLGVQSGAK